MDAIYAMDMNLKLILYNHLFFLHCKMNNKKEKNEIEKNGHIGNAT